MDPRHGALARHRRNRPWLAASLAASTACATAREVPQSAHHVAIEITRTHTSPNCAAIDVEIVNHHDRRPAYIILSGDAPFTELITSTYTNDIREKHVRLSLAERPLMGVSPHRKLPEQIPVAPGGKLSFRIRVSIPLNESFTQSAKYSEHGYPPAANLAHVVRGLSLPFWLRVNIGVVSKAVETQGVDTIPADVADEILRRQFIAESRSVRLTLDGASDAVTAKCHPVLER